ncbi:hypothetical protein JQC91_12645 [Jannaschia sp. Os4]|uniref:hypothetical protein n=1 Tax=Jannaschia sp. Os4 TaxID=2807617 RepID=UPI00193AB0D3|nr:hypothetical protein [Jannaschia sp. Os4]MBM2577149.1 hypothetical protein [Jannaschia sp. Os4]
MLRRGFLTLGAAALLGGCVASQDQVFAPGSTAPLRVVDVRVDATRAAARDPRGFDAPVPEVNRTIRGAALPVLQQANASGTRPVVVELTVTQILVTNAALASIGSSSSTMAATAVLRDARTDAAIGQPFGVTGSTEFRAGGLLGAAITAGALAQRGERGELAKAAQNMGRRVALAVFGADPLAN